MLLATPPTPTTSIEASMGNSPRSCCATTTATTGATPDMSLQDVGSGGSRNKSDDENTAEKEEEEEEEGTAVAATVTSESVTEAAPKKRLVRRGEVNCRWLYNQVQASRGMILIDTRSKAEYERDSIPSALSIPPMEGCATLEDVEKRLLDDQRYLFSSKKRKLRDVVLFGDAVKKIVADDGLDARNGASCSWLRQLEQLIIEDGLVTSVKLMYDGFLTFKYRYPFYTTSALMDEISGQLTRTKSGTHNLNYPNEILEGFLFLGNMWHAQSKQVVSHLGITHVVNASLDVGNTFERDGVKYLNVTIKDRPEADISPYFDAAYRFIESAKRMQHGRVLVHCTQGISRSATLVITYLMRANNWSLVTAVNFAMASRGVVYPNQGFIKSLMLEEFRLYKGNSITSDEVDTLLQNLIPDRPVPLQSHSNKTENCSRCQKMFSLLEWKHKCSYCRKAFCSKCTNTRLANPEREKSAASNGAVDEQRPRRVCQVCVSRLWQINLPRSRKGLQSRMQQRCKHLNVNSLSTFGRTVCISYFEGTEPQAIMDVLKIRFSVKENQIIDISREDGEPICTIEEIGGLPDEAEVFVSVGKAGNIQEHSQRGSRQQLHGAPSAKNHSNHRQPQLRHQQERSRQQFRRDLQSPRDQFFRERRSSEGFIDTLQHIENSARHPDAPRTRSFQLEPSNVEASTEMSLTIEDPELAERKFRELWNLSFPSMGLIERAALLKIKRPAILMDVMLGMSSLSCGALTLEEFSQRLIELGYSDSDRQAVISLLDTAHSADKTDSRLSRSSETLNLYE
uniref:Protein-tyrosine-phosphatase n=1 Tax=Hyaloperonospora arabidopsidis (strain Emoy2) TaxID=559515 RepID=M4BV01_HYAAE